MPAIATRERQPAASPAMAPRELRQAAAIEKVYAAEKNTAGIRLLIVILNGCIFLGLEKHTGQPVILADTILGLALAYSAVVYFFEPYTRYPILTHSYFTSVSDASLISIWLSATGGYDSLYFVLWYASMAAIAFRFTYRRTLIAAGAYGAVYLGLLQLLGQLGANLEGALIRTGFIFLVGVAAAEVARGTYAQALTKVAVQEVNADLERRVAERTAALEAVNGELRNFTRALSEDLQAPLSRIEIASERLLGQNEARLPERGRDYAVRVRRAAGRMTELIDDLRDLSELNDAELRRQPVDLSELAQQVTGELARNEQGRQVEIVVQPEVRDSGDARLIGIVLNNLIANAWKFTAGRVPARIEFGRTAADGQRAYFVRDNGAGFDMAYYDKLFRPFQRLHTAAEFEGTGIGLATVARIVTRHGGQVWAESQPGQGATFYFTLGGSTDGG